MQIDLSRQTLTLLTGGQSVACYTVSTALNGPGEKSGSGCTPRGFHSIRMKLGEGEPLNTVFIGRRPSGEIYSPELALNSPQRDWILTRILWLTGREPGVNRGGDCDTLRRFIYIHGTPDSEPMGEARSHGCIRMHNYDLLDLFDQVDAGTLVDIRESFTP
ncbi:MAG: L,D-transpeptidase [Candidatus Sedimenticola sp. (ex Thyasira tokunagai)]